MKRKFKSLTAKCLASLILVSAISPALAQNYNYSRPSRQNTNSNYNSGNYNPGFSAPVQNYNQNNGYNNNLPPLQGRVTTVPAGTVINGVTPSTTISTQYLTAGDAVSFNLNQPYYFNGVAVLPAGTNIQGNAVIAKKAGFGDGYGQLKIMLNRASLPNGQSVPISGKLVTNDGTGILTGGTTGGRALDAGKNTALGAGAGALMGLIGSAVSGGKIGRGTAIMTGVGGGLGLGKTLIDKGKDVVLEAGQPVQIILDQPLTVGGGQSGNQYGNQSGNDNNYNY